MKQSFIISKLLFFKNFESLVLEVFYQRQKNMGFVADTMQDEIEVKNTDQLKQLPYFLSKIT